MCEDICWWNCTLISSWRWHYMYIILCWKLSKVMFMNWLCVYTELISWTQRYNYAFWIYECRTIILIYTCSDASSYTYVIELVPVYIQCMWITISITSMNCQCNTMYDVCIRLLVHIRRVNVIVDSST